LQIESVVVCRIKLIRGAQAQHQGVIKSRANANLKLHPARRHYRIASPRITVVFLSYLSYPRQECNTGNRTPRHEGVARGHRGTLRSRTHVPSLESHDKRLDAQRENDNARENNCFWFIALYISISFLAEILTFNFQISLNLRTFQISQKCVKKKDKIYKNL